MKKSRLKLGLRRTPDWVAERMADRPPWRCRTEKEREWFTEFVINDLNLRYFQIGARNADKMTESLNTAPSRDRRQVPFHRRVVDPVELAAQAVPLIREIFEDYWPEGRETGRVYRGHDPSVEEIAATFGEVTADQVRQKLKKSKKRRPALK